MILDSLTGNEGFPSGDVTGILFNTSSSADVKPDADVDDWEAIATDEEKGEFPSAASKEQLFTKSNRQIGIY